jgi:hypothetical protein
LIQPEKSRRKKASGGGIGSIAGSLTQVRFGSKGGVSWPFVKGGSRRRRGSPDDVVYDDFLEFGFGRVFAQHEVTFPVRCHRRP